MEIPGESRHFNDGKLLANIEVENTGGNFLAFLKNS